MTTDCADVVDMTLSESSLSTDVRRLSRVSHLTGRACMCCSSHAFTFGISALSTRQIPAAYVVLMPSLCRGLACTMFSIERNEARYSPPRQSPPDMCPQCPTPRVRVRDSHVRGLMSGELSATRARHTHVHTQLLLFFTLGRYIPQGV